MSWVSWRQHQTYWSSIATLRISEPISPVPSPMSKWCYTLNKVHASADRRFQQYQVFLCRSGDLHAWRMSEKMENYNMFVCPQEVFSLEVSPNLVLLNIRQIDSCDFCKPPPWYANNIKCHRVVIEYYMPLNGNRIFSLSRKSHEPWVQSWMFPKLLQFENISHQSVGILYLNRSETPIILVKNPQMYGGVQSLEISDYQKVESKMRPRCSYTFWDCLVLNTGSTGP